MTLDRVVANARIGNRHSRVLDGRKVNLCDVDLLGDRKNIVREVEDAGTDFQIMEAAYMIFMDRFHDDD